MKKIYLLSLLVGAYTYGMQTQELTQQNRFQTRTLFQRYAKPVLKITTGTALLLYSLDRTSESIQFLRNQKSPDQWRSLAKYIIIGMIPLELLGGFLLYKGIKEWKNA